MTTTLIRLRRSALTPGAIPPDTAEGCQVSLRLFGQPVRDGAPGRVTVLTDEWIEVVWE